MIQLVAPIAVVAALGGVTHSLLRAGWMAARARRAGAARRRLREDEVRALVAEFGTSANSFMTLYPGFEYFAHPDASVRGMIAFTETPEAWVGGAEPFCAPADRAKLLSAFAQAAAALGKTALILPVEEALVPEARSAGYRAVMIGTEPTWELARFPRTGRTWTDVVPTAKALAGKGAQVSAFEPDRLAPDDRAQLDEMVRQWLGTRKMDTLAFLNQVDPWYRQADKRYFRIECQGRTQAFLAAIPIWARNGWYLIDLIRRPDSPAGSTELLLLQAMRLLREQGAAVCTMGVAPLSGIDQASRYPAAGFDSRRRTYAVLHWIYEKGNAFYNFKPLHQYKLKLDPTSGPPVFLLYSPKLGARALLGLARAFQPKGMARAAGSGALRMLTRFSLAEWIRGQLGTRTVVRSVPPTWARLLQRCKLTAALLAANLAVFFATTDGAGRLDPAIESAWGFSWPALLASPWHALAASPWLHWSVTHLCLNIVALVVFTGGLEYLAGTPLTLACYAVPMCLANPLTAATLALASRATAAIDPAQLDVGASLGIFGCAGALSRFVRWGGWLVGGLAAAAAASAWFNGSLQLNHLAALGLGWAVSWAVLKS
jgi:membrane associated rhomboid family serine protease